MTHSEQYLWLQLQKQVQNGHSFYLQRSPGTNCLDFYCPSARLLVGVSPDNRSLEEHLQVDLERIMDLHKSGISVFRFTAIEVLENIEFVIDTIKEFLETHHEH